MTQAIVPREGIGLRVRRLRTTARMTQEQLADRVSEALRRSYSQAMVSMIENGDRHVDKRSLLSAFAYALHVPEEELTGQPYPPTVLTDLALYAAVPEIRSALDEPDNPPQPRGLDALRAATDQAMAARMNCDYASLGRILPGVLTETRMLGGDDPRAAELFVRGCVTGALALKPAGYVDLAYRLANQALDTALRLDDAVAIAAAQCTVAQCALATGNRVRSMTLAAAAADRLADSADQRASDRYAWGTILHLHAALSAATLHRGGDAAEHLAEAGVLAALVEGDPWQMEAGPANVKTWAVGIALENGDADRAPRLARLVDVTQLRTPHRRARLFMDTGRGHFVAGNTAAAVRSLLAADDAAPGDLRNRPVAVELIGQMVRDSTVRGGSEALRELATRVGVSQVPA